MIDSQNNYKEQLFKLQIPRGTVLLFKDFPLSDGEKKNKYIIILNRCHEDNSYFVLTTSNKRNYHDHFPERYLVIQKGELKFFREETIIDITSIDCILLNSLYQRYLKQNPSSLQIVGALPSQMIDLLDDLISKSDNISMKHKKIVLKKFGAE